MWKKYWLKKIVSQQRCESKRVYPCSTIGSTKKPPKRKQTQVRETDGRPSCKPGSCGRSGNGGVWGPRRFGGEPGRTHRGTKRPRVAKSVATPKAQEFEEHQASAHAVHRSSCVHCMRARAAAARDQTVSHDEESEVPVITLDYCFFGEKEGETANLEVKIVKDCRSKMTWATTIPTKGPDLFSVNFLLSCINETGYRRIILKSDNEPEIPALKREVKVQAKDVEIVLQEAPTGDHSANGAVKVAVRDQKRQVRAHLNEVEENLYRKIGRHSSYFDLAESTCGILPESILNQR